MAVIVSPAMELSTRRRLASADNIRPHDMNHHVERMLAAQRRTRGWPESSEEKRTLIVSLIGDATSAVLKCRLGQVLLFFQANLPLECPGIADAPSKVD
jgi:hypothetical protein